MQTIPNYVLSPHFVIKPPTHTTTNQNTATNTSDNFELIHQTKDRIYLINPTVKAFLEAFQEQNNLPAVVEQFANAAACQTAQIEPILQQFFKEMRARGVLVNSDTAIIDPKIKTAQFEIGQLLGDYQLLKSLRSGEKEAVYIAQKLDENKETEKVQKVVLKVLNLPEHWAEEKKQWCRHEFYQEFHFLQKLHDHPNIYNLLDFVDNPQNPYAVLNYIEGKSWKSFIRANKKNLTRSQRFCLIQQAFAALAHLHGQGILHGDIHASNFMIQSQYEQVLLIDFGFTNHAVRAQNEVKHAGGVFQYIPPERISTNSFDFIDGPATYSSEVFQLGIITYFALYETMPFKGVTWQELSQSILEETPIFLSHLPSGQTLPTEVTDLVQQMLHKDPAQRFSNAVLLLQAWEKATTLSQQKIPLAASATVFKVD